MEVTTLFGTMKSLEGCYVLLYQMFKGGTATEQEIQNNVSATIWWCVPEMFGRLRELKAIEDVANGIRLTEQGEQMFHDLQGMLVRLDLVK